MSRVYLLTPVALPFRLFDCYIDFFSILNTLCLKNVFICCPMRAYTGNLNIQMKSKGNEKILYIIIVCRHYPEPVTMQRILKWLCLLPRSSLYVYRITSLEVPWHAGIHTCAQTDQVLTDILFCRTAKTTGTLCVWPHNIHICSLMSLNGNFF